MTESQRKRTEIQRKAPDMEKVIRGLEVCSTVEDLAPCPNECPYNKPDAVCYGTARLMQDALALLREMEPVEPIKKPGIVEPYKCGACGAVLGWESEKQRFCLNCGREVKWNA